MTPPAIVIEGSVSRAAVDRLCAELSARGACISGDWRAAGPAVGYTGVVDDEQSAAQAVQAALAGAQIVVAAEGDRHVIDRMCDDLRSLGPLDHRIAEPSESPTLSTDEWALLDRLLTGDSLGEAAAAIHTSRRTADRRLASARRAMGVTTTAELLAVAARLRA